MASSTGFSRAAKQWRSHFRSLLTARSHQTIERLILSGLMALLLLPPAGCANQSGAVRLIELPDVPNVSETRKLSGSMSEVAPPAIFSDLDELIADVRPQVAIAFPKSDQILETTSVAPKLTLRGLSIYKDKSLNLGPHLQIILDNQPAQSVYSLDEPIEFSELAPGSHTLRILAVKPWGESFKNEEAYAQTTFHIFAKTNENTPTVNRPQLIYSEPQGTYGAQPILLDFYLNNAPLHFIAESDPNIADWRIRCDVNGQSFVFDQWQPVYLKGFKPGQNWVQLTLIDEQDNPIKNEFNSTVRLVNYEPERRDTLAKLTRGELSLQAAGQIVDPNYEPPAEIIKPVTPTEPEPEIDNSKAEPAAIEGEELKESEEEIAIPAVTLPETLAEPAEDAEDAEDALEKVAETALSEFSTFEKFAEDRVVEEETIEEAVESESLTDLEETSTGEATGAIEEVESEKIESEASLEENAEPNSEEDFEPASLSIRDDLSVEEKILDEDLITSEEPGLEEPGLEEDLLVDDLPIEDSQEADAVANPSPSDSPGFFNQVQTFWRDLNTPEPPSEYVPEAMVPNPTTDVFSVDSPLLTPELQLSDLDELSDQTSIPEILTTPESSTEVEEPAMEPAD